MSADLRARVREEARREGLTDGAWLRRLVADRCGEVAAADRASGRRVPSEALEGLASAIREIGGAYGPLSHRPPDLDAAKAALGKAREVLMHLPNREMRNA